MKSFSVSSSNKYKSLGFIALMLFTTISCSDRDNCEDVIQINFNQNEYSAILQTQQDEIKVNSPFNIQISLPTKMTGSDSIEYTISSEPTIWIKFFDLSSGTSSSSDIFNIPSTMHAAFTEYFDVKVLEGSKHNQFIFNFKAELKDDEFRLNLEYQPKIKGVFGIDIYYDSNEIVARQEKVLRDFCFNYQSPLLIWEENKLNYVKEHEEGNSDHKSTFVIKVN